jgi:hypothetical protein
VIPIKYFSIISNEMVDELLKCGDMEPYDHFSTRDAIGNVYESTPRLSQLADHIPVSALEFIIDEVPIYELNGNGGHTPCLLIPKDTETFDAAVEMLKKYGFHVLDTRRGYQDAIDGIAAAWPSLKSISVGSDKRIVPLLVLAQNLTEEGYLFWRILYDRGWLSATGGNIPPIKGMGRESLKIPENMFILAMVPHENYWQSGYNPWDAVRSKLGVHFHFDIDALKEPRNR